MKLKVRTFTETWEREKRMRKVPINIIGELELFVRHLVRFFSCLKMSCKPKPLNKTLMLVTTFIVSSCTINDKTTRSTFTLAFGSCNNQNEENLMWSEINKHNPDVWVWGGDIVYADHNSQDMKFLAQTYNKQKEYPSYKKLIKSTEVIGTWDDHDYGVNDGGVEYSHKKQSQQLFLDFMGVADDSPRRSKQGVYNAHDYQVGDYTIKIIVLDTRFFRTAITDDPDPSNEKRYMPNKYGKGTLLGEKQWQWLQIQLNNSKADFNVVTSSIQFLSPYHGFEKWANMPHEVNKMEQLIKTSQANNVIILSGDRHISEFSLKEIDGLGYPLIDFTSSGLNRGLNRDKRENNPYRLGGIVTLDSFGVMVFDFKNKKVTMEIRGKNNSLISKHIQSY